MGSWFYKDGKGKLFDGGVCPEGWTDHPDKVYVAPEKPKVVKKKSVKRKITAEPTE